MRRDEVKYILNGYRRAKKTIDILQREIEEVEEMLVSVKAVDYAKPRVDSSVMYSDFQSMTIDRLSTLKAKCEVQWRDAVIELEKIKAIIDSVEDPTERDILSRRYISLEHWEDMSKSIPADYRYLFRIHDRALDKLAIKSHYDM